MTPNPKTREGFEYWDMFCKLPRFSFWRGDEDEKGAVIRVPDSTGNWIEVYKAAELVGGLQETINDLESENKALKRRLELKSV